MIIKCERPTDSDSKCTEPVYMQCDDCGYYLCENHYGGDDEVCGECRKALASFEDPDTNAGDDDERYSDK